MVRCLAWRAFVLAAFFFAGTSVAVAHAALLATDPPSGAEVAHAPSTIRLHFGEAVESSLGSIRLLDDAGGDHTRGKPFHPAGDASSVAIESAPLANGRYVVAWSVVSADSHVVSGAFAFGVGVPAGDVPVALTEAASPGSIAVSAVMRFFELSALLIGAGLAFALAIVVHPIAKIHTTVVEFSAWIVVAFLACADIVAHAVFDNGPVSAVLSTHFGLLRVILFAAALLAIVAIVLPRRRTGLLGVASAVAMISESLSGHGATGIAPAIGIVADAAHLVAAAAWIAVLIATLIVADIVDVRRVSTVATVAVALLAVSGVVQTVRNVDSFASLVQTTYGLLICAKIVLFFVALGFALISRARLNGGAAALARSIRIELVVLTVVVAVTGVLIDGRPPRSANAAQLSPSVQSQFVVRDVHVAVGADRAADGSWQLHITTDRAGVPVAVDGVEAALRESTRGVGPLAVALHRESTGIVAGRITVPFPGRWTATVRVRVGDFDEGQTFVNLLP